VNLLPNGAEMSAEVENLKIASLCAAILIVVCVIVGFQVRAEISCEAAGGISVRSFNFPSFTECVT
jgi:hypothetical protein